MQLFQTLCYFSIHVVNAHGENEANSKSDDETETADLPIEIDTASLTASEAIRCLDEVKQFAEVHGDNNLNMTLTDLIGRFEALKLQKLKQSDIHKFFKSS